MGYSGCQGLRQVLYVCKKTKEQEGAAQSVGAQEVLDLSEPKNPKPLQTFDGVTRVLADDGRHLIYIANGEGLWILRRIKDSLLPWDSESVFLPCQIVNSASHRVRARQGILVVPAVQSADV